MTPGDDSEAKLKRLQLAGFGAIVAALLATAAARKYLELDALIMMPLVTLIGWYAGKLTGIPMDPVVEVALKLMNPTTAARIYTRATTHPPPLNPPKT